MASSVSKSWPLSACPLKLAVKQSRHISVPTPAPFSSPAHGATVSDFSNRKDIRRAEKASRLAERARIDFLKQIMSSPLGREWLHGFLESCYIFGEPFVRGA